MSTEDVENVPPLSASGDAPIFDSNQNKMSAENKIESIEELEIPEDTEESEYDEEDDDELEIEFVDKEDVVESEEIEEEEEEEQDDKAAGDVATYDSDSENQKENDVRNIYELEADVDKITTDVKDILDVSAGISQLLLQKFRWNKERLLENFYETTDINSFLTDHNVIPPPTQDFPAEATECGICFEESVLTGLTCQHQFCFGCWNSYLTEKIIDGGQSEITCMQPECKLLFQEENISFYIADPVVMSMYRRAVINNYVETNCLLKWCHGADCDNAVKVTLTSTRHVSCTCGSSFCFSCNKDSHEPISCRLLNQWIKNDDQESFKWILTNTKECPRCQAPIEKNGGCNHMTCNNKNCRFEFCWLCMGNWVGHVQCNRYEGDSNRERSMVNLERYEWFKTRYMAHQQSLKLETELRASIIDKMAKLREFFALSASEVLYLQKAQNVLTECRHTLMYSYVFAYYLEPNLHSVIFEDNQKFLQSAVEELSEILEMKLENDNLDTLKQRVIDRYRYVDQRRKLLLKHCVEGEEKDYWVYKE